jgi:hypothetical protein
MSAARRWLRLWLGVFEMRKLILRWLMPVIERAVADAISSRVGLLPRGLEEQSLAEALSDPNSELSRAVAKNFAIRRIR